MASWCAKVSAFVKTTRAGDVMLLHEEWNEAEKKKAEKMLEKDGVQVEEVLEELVAGLRSGEAAAEVMDVWTTKPVRDGHNRDANAIEENEEERRRLREGEKLVMEEAVCLALEDVLETLCAREPQSEEAWKLMLQRYSLLVGTTRLPGFRCRAINASRLAQCAVERLAWSSRDEEIRVLRQCVHWFYMRDVQTRMHFRIAIGDALRALATRMPKYRLAAQQHHPVGSSGGAGRKGGGGGGGGGRGTTIHVTNLCALLEVVDAICRGFVAPLNAAHTGLLHGLLLPLHATNAMFDDTECLLGRFHAPLMRCIGTLVSFKPALVVDVVRFLVVHAWPKSGDACSAKECLLLRELAVLLGMETGAAVRKEAMRLAMPLIIKCSASEHAGVLETAVGVLETDAVFGAAFAVDAVTRRRFLTPTIDALVAGGKPHWSTAVNSARLGLLRRMEITFPQEAKHACEESLERAQGMGGGGRNGGGVGCGGGTASSALKASALSPAPLLPSTTTWAPTPFVPPLVPPQPTTAAPIGAPTPRPLPMPPPAVRPGAMPSAVSARATTTNGAAPKPSAPNRGVWQPTKAPFARIAPVAMPSFVSSRPGRMPSPLASIVQERDEDDDECAMDDDDSDACSDNGWYGRGNLTRSFFQSLAGPNARNPSLPPAVVTGLHSWKFTRLPALVLQDLVFGNELGRGAFSTVQHARHIIASSPSCEWPEYAVKRISDTTIRVHKYTRSVRREISVLSDLVHPNVARLVTSFRWRDCYYLILEYASMGDLHTIISDMGSLGVSPTRFWMGEVLAALRYVHGLGFAFGDLKPENVMLTADGHVKLGDFGGARPITDDARQRLAMREKDALRKMRDGDWKTRMGVAPESGGGRVVEGGDGENKKKKKKEEEEDAMDVVDGCDSSRHLGECRRDIDDDGGNEEDLDDHDIEDEEVERFEGTPAYMSPELVLGSPPSSASDFWALGCVLFFCLAGRPPVCAETQDEIMSGVLAFSANIEDTFPVGFDDEAARLVSALLDQDPASRLGLEEIAAHAFFNSLAPSDDGDFDVDTLVSMRAPRASAGVVAIARSSTSSPSPSWAQRQNSILWAAAPRRDLRGAAGSDDGGANRCAASRLDAVAETGVEATVPFVP